MIMARVRRKDLKRQRAIRKFLESEEGQRITDAIIASLVGDPEFDRVRKRAEDADKGIYPQFMKRGE